jgi:hypothetical protein
MRHEPSDSLPSLQPIADQRCPSCRAVRPLDDLPAQAGTPAGCCVLCRRRSATVADRRRQRTLRQIARQTEAGYRALLTEHLGGGGDAA